MKQLLAGTALVFIIGVAAFLYRNAMELPYSAGNESGACTLEAKLCPDGSAVGRTGPLCTFAPCAFPNVELPEVGIGFVLPDGYGREEASEGSAAVFSKSTANPPNTITIRAHTIPEGETGEGVMFAATVYDPSGMTAESIDDFERVLVNGNTFYVAGIERFEGHVTSRYYLLRERDVLSFEIAEREVLEWTNPELVIEDLPGHQGLRQLLGTLAL